MKKHLIDVDQDFHALTHVFVVKGLENNPTVKEIMDELKVN